MSDKRMRVFVTGKVQGVFFRQSLKVVANQNNVDGWVRNLKDGRVEAVLEGKQPDVDAVVEWCHAGPANAWVESAETTSEEFSGEFTKFDVLY